MNEQFQIQEEFRTKNILIQRQKHFRTWDDGLPNKHFMSNQQHPKLPRRHTISLIDSKQLISTSKPKK